MSRCIKIIYLLLFGLLLPTLTFAQLNIEEQYPAPPGLQTITSRSGLPEIIKFAISWMIILAGLAAVVSLIWAGLLYLTSAGRPGQLQSAKKRIWDSGIGLLIVFGAYLVLRTINPSMTVVSFQTQPIESGIFLFTEGSGFTDFKDGKLGLSELLKTGGARYLSNDIRDYQKEFGWLVVAKKETDQAGKLVITLNFENFPLAGIGFLGDYGKRMKVLAYPDREFLGTPLEFTYYGGAVSGAAPTLLPTKTVMVGGSEMNVFDLDMEKFPPYAIKEPYKEDINGHLEEFNKGREQFNPPVPNGPLHPPLSLRMSGNGPGVYLYAKNNEAMKTSGEEKYFFLSEQNLGNSNINFEDKAEYIAIKNKALGTPLQAEDHDYLAILHDDRNYAGKLKIFFTTRDMQIWEYDQVKGWTSRLEKVVNVPTSDLNPTKKIPLDEQATAIFGRIDNDASSLEIFEISPNPSVCKEVRLCTQKTFEGGCISFTWDGKEKESVDNIAETQPMPFVPQNIPEESLGKISVVDEEGNKKDEAVKLAKNIRSIKIEGNCAVVLMQNKLELETGAQPDVTAEVGPMDLPASRYTNFQRLQDYKWEDSSPGSHSEVFTKSDTDLSDNEIGRCGWTKTFGFQQPNPCASAIAIYPVK